MCIAYALTHLSCWAVELLAPDAYVLRLSQESDSLWWDAFATEFFEDDATLTLTFCLEDGPKRYSEYIQYMYSDTPILYLLPGSVVPHLGRRGNAQFVRGLGREEC